MRPEEEDVIIDIGSETTQHTAQLDNLFKLTMKKKWDKVVAVYIDNHWARTEMLTKSRETVLHVAVSSHNIVHSDNIKFDHVQKMIDAIPQENLLEILSSVNDEGNTVLHLAAAVGWEEVCIHILEKDFKLIRMQNNRKETPLFVAAHYGNLKAFVCLHETYMKGAGEPDYTLCRRNDGMTVLHAAIAGEHFELAYQIMYHYKKLTTYFNEAGESPLHVLAKKPNVFESCSTLRFYDYIIYRCVFVDELKKYKYVKRDTKSIEARAAYPENYRTCVRILDFLWWPIRRSFLENTWPCPSLFPDAWCAKKGTTGTPKDEENQQTSQGPQDDRYYPPNYTTCIMLFKFGMKIILTVLGLGFHEIQRIIEKKHRNVYAVKIMNQLIESEEGYKYSRDGRKPEGQNAPVPSHGPDNIAKSPPDEYEDSSDQAQPKNDTPLLIAAKMGILEMVEKILMKFPVAIQDVDSDGKNVLLLAAENRQTTVFKFLLNLKLPEYLFHQVDNKGNSILHLAAMLGEQHPWHIPGAALQMQWEIKWYKFVKRKIPRLSYAHSNENGETARKIFTNTHEPLVDKGTKWLIKTSESCSVVAALIATVAFATSATVPGGLDQSSGHPIMENRTAFDIFSITSLLALCLSVTSLVFFVAIITSRCQESDFKSNLPMKLVMGLTALFASIAAMLVSFCAGHTFILGNTVRILAVPIYAFACVPVTLFGLAQLPLYFDLLVAACKEVPVRSYKVHRH